MKLLEAIIWIFILSLIMVSATSISSISKLRVKTYFETIKKDSEKINLHNYSNNLINWINSSSTWYIYFSWNNFYTWNVWTYYYKCDMTWWNHININLSYTWVFCNIDFENEKIFNYKLIN